MQHQEGGSSILVVDPDDQFTKVLRENKETAQFSLQVVRNGRDAQVAISSSDRSLAGIFIAPETSDTSWLSVIKCAHFYRPGLAIYVVEKDQSWRAVTDIDLKKLGIKKSVSKEITYSEMVKLIAPITAVFNAQSALEVARKNADEVGKASEAGDDAFISIRASDFISGTDSFFDIYARTPNARYLKLVHAGDPFDPERLENYLKKGVKFFFIRKEAQESYLQYCDHLATALLKSDGFATDFKATQTLNQGEEVMRNLQINGVTPKNIAYAEKFTKNVRTLISLLEPEKKSIIGEFIQNLGAYDHGVGTSMLAGMLANQLEIASENPFQIVGMAAMFHDLALASMPAACQAEEESAMSAQELALYRQHPRLSAEQLKTVGGVSQATLQAVEQHHMKLGKKGFPPRTGTSLVGRISEIVGIADDFHRMTQRCQGNPNLDIVLEMEQHVFPCFSRVTILAFQKVFFPHFQKK